MRTRHSISVAIIALISGALVVTACSNDEATREAAPLGDSEATEFADTNVQFATASTRVCVTNESGSSIEVQFTKSDSKEGEGTLSRGSTACASGTFFNGDDVTGTITSPKSRRSYVFGAVNKASGFPSFAFQPEGCPEDRAAYVGKATATKSDDVHRFSKKRLNDTEYKEFAIVVTDESRPASSPLTCW